MTTSASCPSRVLLVEDLAVPGGARRCARRGRGPPFGDDLLDGALQRTGGTTEESITRIADGLYVRVLDRLAERGLLRKSPRSMTFGVLSRSVWQVADPAHADALRRELTLVLVGDLVPTRRAGPIITLLAVLAGCPPP